MLKKFRASLRGLAAKDAGARDSARDESGPPDDFVRMRAWIRQAHAGAEQADGYDTEQEQGGEGQPDGAGEEGR